VAITAVSSAKVADVVSCEIGSSEVNSIDKVMVQGHCLGVLLH
jgi:hypothetical protein